MLWGCKTLLPGRGNCLKVSQEHLVSSTEHGGKQDFLKMVTVKKQNLLIKSLKSNWHPAAVLTDKKGSDFYLKI